MTTFIFTIYLIDKRCVCVEAEMSKDTMQEALRGLQTAVDQRISWTFTNYIDDYFDFSVLVNGAHVLDVEVQQKATEVVP